tara:strand:+ start:203 stop:1075 length:873 start_codon:yes stop_codon:yes gene_type:complete
MKKIIILVPIFNDWDSFQKLILEINESVKDFKNFSFDCIVVNDASTNETPKLRKPDKIHSLKILTMKKNKGHARCNAFGIRYISQNENFDYLILMDGDGEDRPVELKSIIKKILENPNRSVVAERIKRSEGLFFKFLYSMHKIITLIFTGKKIKFGNYTCLTKENVILISSKGSLWSSYSGTIKRYIKDFDTVDSIRGNRYVGPSKMSLYTLVIHSFSIIAVFKSQVLTRSILLILVLMFLKTNLGIISIFFQSVVFLFCIMIYLVSLREKKDELISSQENLKNIQNIIH